MKMDRRTFALTVQALLVYFPCASAMGRDCAACFRQPISFCGDRGSAHHR